MKQSKSGAVQSMKGTNKNKGGGSNMMAGPNRAIWMGGALGLYFGWFFRPMREPNLYMALGLSILIGIIFLVLSRFKREDRKPFTHSLARFPLNVFQYFVILAVLESRHFLHDWGGRMAVVIFTGIMGLLFGVWYNWRENRVRSE